jgi:hypothetical protein
MKDHASGLADAYRLEKIEAKNKKIVHGLFDGMKKIQSEETDIEERLNKSVPKTQKYEADILSGYSTIQDLQDDHPAKVYMRYRQLPEESLSRIYYCDNFAELGVQIDPSKKDELYPEARIVFPLRYPDGRLFAINSRSMDPDCPVRYITLRKPEYDAHKYYGLERYSPDKHGYLVEGPMDSEFLPNCLAFAGAGKLKRGKLPFDPENMTIVFDNEPNNKDIKRFMNACLVNGFNVCIWPNWFCHKDINDAILAGMTKEEVKEIIDNHTENGVSGQAKLAMWHL